MAAQPATEGRVKRAEWISLAALGVSILSFAWSAWQAHLREDERIVIEARGTDAHPRVTNLRCNSAGPESIVTIDLGWKVAIYNPSLQPVTATDIGFTGISDNGAAMHSLLTTRGLDRHGLPQELPPRGLKTLEVAVPAMVTHDFKQWVIANRLCERPIVVDWLALARAAGFQEFGAKPMVKSPSLVAKVQTASATESSVVAAWTLTGKR